MYAGRPWTIRQYAGFSTAEESNAFYRKALAGGQKGLSVAFDLATHRGYDSDHPRVEGDVGKAGVAIDSVEDMKILFDGIPLKEMSVSMTMNGAVIPILASFIVAGQEQGCDAAELSGTIQNDILKEFMVRNTYIYPPEPSMRIVSDIIAYTAENMPKFNSISISGYHMQEAGATLVQELAFTLADGREYVRAAIARWARCRCLCRAAFLLLLHRHELLHGSGEAARGPAFVVAHHVGVQSEKSLVLDAANALPDIRRIAAGTGRLQQCRAHRIRGDERPRSAAPSRCTPIRSTKRSRCQRSSRPGIARNTQLILQHETGVTKVVDPLAGSYYVESLTNELAEKAWALMEEIEAMGGMTKAVNDGYPKRLIEEAATRKQAAVDRGDEVIVGVNKYRPDNDDKFEILTVDNHAVREAQIKRLDRIRRQRDPKQLETALEELARVARTGEGNLLAAAVEAARARASVGEITEAMRRAFGDHAAEPEVVHDIYGPAYRDEPEYKTLVERFKGACGRHGRSAEDHGRQARAGTGTIAAPRSSHRPSAISVSTCSPVRCSRPPKKPRRWRSGAR